MSLNQDRLLGGITEEAMLEAIVLKHGNMLRVAKHLGFYREHVAVHVKNRPRLAKALAAAREAFKDVAQGVLEDAILAGDISTAKFWLATQARDRGFGLNADPAAIGGDPNLRVTTVNILAVEPGVSVDPKQGTVIVKGDELEDENGPIIEGVIEPETPELSPEPEVEIYSQPYQAGEFVRVPEPDQEVHNNETASSSRSIQNPFPGTIPEVIFE